MLDYGSVGRVQTKYTTLCFHLLPWHFFVAFHQKFSAFIIFISFFDEVSNFRNRILTNQKHELVVSNCQWNCMGKYVCEHRHMKVYRISNFLMTHMMFDANSFQMTCAINK